MKRSKRLRRMAGYLRSRLPELQLAKVVDPRSRQGRRWRLAPLLKSVLVGLMAGIKGLGALESLGTWMTDDVRGVLGLPGRIADTTLRDLLCRLDWRSVRQALHRAIGAARRRKALVPQGLPFHMAALDGKVTALPSGDGPYAQWHVPDTGKPYGLMRTTTATLVTAAGRPCIDVTPIPAHTNEMGHFMVAFGELVRLYGNLIKLVSYDAGAGCEQNAKAVVTAGKHYLFRLADERWHLHQLAMQLVADTPVVAEKVEIRSQHRHVRRCLRVFGVNSGKLPALARNSAIWSHARLLLMVETETFDNDVCVTRETKLCISSLPNDALSPQQWLWAIVNHWGVETTHQVLDTTFAEDERPWIQADPNGMLVVLVLRRLAYTLLTLFRSVTQRAEDKRLRPWREIVQWVDKTLTATTGAMLAGLREIKATAVQS